MSRLVCFIGVIGSGKDYQSKKLITEEGFLHINFADELRNMTWELLRWTPKNDEEYELFKLGKINIPGFGYVDGRKFLQNLGTSIRVRNQDFWVDCWYRKAYSAKSENNNIVCSDLRFINELKSALSFSLLNIKPEFIFCNYKSSRYNCENTHESEMLAQKILRDGNKDGDVLSHNYIYELIRRYNEIYS